MSPHVADQFTGHLFEGDPRSQVHGAAGCTWPTLPAMRYQLISDNATGIFVVWNITPGLIVRMVNTIDHDLYRYVGVSIPPPFSISRARKVANPATWGYRWEIDIEIGSGCSSIQYRIENPLQKCNVDQILGDGSCIEHPELGSIGSTFRMLQVKYDETVPP